MTMDSSKNVTRVIIRIKAEPQAFLRFTLLYAMCNIAYILSFIKLNVPFLIVLIRFFTHVIFSAIWNTQAFFRQIEITELVQIFICIKTNNTNQFRNCLRRKPCLRYI